MQISECCKLAGEQYYLKKLLSKQKIRHIDPRTITRSNIQRIKKILGTCDASVKTNDTLTKKLISINSLLYRKVQ